MIEHPFAPLLQVDQDYLTKMNEWGQHHKCEVANGGMIGGKFVFQFVPTSIGLVAKIICACGKIEDVTDYASW